MKIYESPDKGKTVYERDFMDYGSRKLISLEEHNKKVMEAAFTSFSTSTPVHNGIECPDCKEELYDTNPNITLTTHPAQKSVHCSCGYSGFRFV